MIVPTARPAPGALAWVSAAGDAPEVDAAAVTPGMGGFLAFFALALVLVLLYRSFTTHMRRVDVRSRIRDEEDERRAALQRGPRGSAPTGESPMRQQVGLDAGVPPPRPDAGQPEAVLDADSAPERP